jgi:hypothetical protein
MIRLSIPLLARRSKMPEYVYEKIHRECLFLRGLAARSEVICNDYMVSKRLRERTWSVHWRRTKAIYEKMRDGWLRASQFMESIGWEARAKRCAFRAQDCSLWAKGCRDAPPLPERWVYETASRLTPVEKKSRMQLEAEIMGRLEPLISHVLDWWEVEETFTLKEIEEVVLRSREKIGVEIATVLLAPLRIVVDPTPPKKVCIYCGRRIAYKGREDRFLQTRVGTVKIKQDVYRCPRCWFCLPEPSIRDRAEQCQDEVDADGDTSNPDT